MSQTERFAPAPLSGTVPEDIRPLRAQAPGLPAVPGYVLTRELARGGMGTVYAAHDPALQRPVAVKVMHHGCDAGRFVVEARLTAQLPHPGVPPVHAVGLLPDGRPFLAMKLIAGRTLAEAIDSAKRADLPHLTTAFEGICQTVGFAHSRGVIHRDLKPQNVMVGEFAEVLVLDWGLARQIRNAECGMRNEDIFPSSTPQSAIRNPQSQVSVAGAVKGTPAYMAPEQARGEDVDVRADVFALGGILAAILTGNPPFTGDSVMDTVLRAARAELGECFEELDGCGADAELVAIAKRALAADRADRYPDGAAVAAALAAYRAGVDDRLRRAERERAAAEAKAVEQRKRRKVQRALAACVLVLVCGGSGFAWWQGKRENARKVEEARLTGERDEQARATAEQAQQGIDANLRLANELRRQYKFAAAGAALAQAEELVARGAPERTAEVDQARRDLDFVVQLDDIRSRKWVRRAEPNGLRSFDLPAAAPRYAKAFRAAGLDVAARPPAETAARVRESTVRGELVGALDDWALFEADEAVRDRVLDVARRADAGAWTDRFRTPEVRRDPAAVARLAADADPEATRPVTLAALAELMQRHGLDPSPLLSAARTRYPDDFELTFALGQWYARNLSDEQIWAFEAARALRPDNAAVLNNLGGALHARGYSRQARAIAERAAVIDPGFALGQFNLGIARFIADDLDGAIAAYTRAVQLDDKLAAAHGNLGVALSKRGDTAGAVAALERAVALAPAEADAISNLGNVLCRSGRLKEGLAAHERALKLAPDDVVVLTNYAAARAQSGDAAGAADLNRRAIKLQSKYPTAHYNLGIALADQGDPEGAATAFERAVQLNPRYARAWTNLGIVLKKQGKLDEALTAYRRAVEADPAHANAWHCLGVALKEGGNDDAAIAAYKKAAGLNPKEPKVFFNLGVAYRDKRDWEREIAAYLEALAADPGDTMSRNNLGIALQRRGDPGEALEVFRRAVAANPDDPASHVNLGCALAAAGRKREALAAYRKAVAVGPKYPLAHYNLGVQLSEAGDGAGAVAAFREAVRLDPKLPHGHFNLGLTLSDLERYAEAVEALRQATAVDPQDAAAHDSLGSALSNAGDRPGAIASYRRALELDPGNARWHFNLGLALNKSGDPGAALTAYKRAAALDPKLVEAHVNIADIYLKQEKYTEGIGAARAAVAAGPQVSVGHAILGRLLFLSGDVSGARAAVTEAVRLDRVRWQRLLDSLPPPPPTAPPPRPVTRP